MGAAGLVEAGPDQAQAVICVESDELATPEIAMRVREARPDVRLVVLLANPPVGRALERVLGTGIILDPAALAAPSFVEVCLRRPCHLIELGSGQFAVAELAVDDDETVGRTFRSRFGHLAPIAPPSVPRLGTQPGCVGGAGPVGCVHSRDSHGVRGAGVA